MPAPTPIPFPKSPVRHDPFSLKVPCQRPSPRAEQVSLVPVHSHSTEHVFMRPPLPAVPGTNQHANSGLKGSKYSALNHHAPGSITC